MSSDVEMPSEDSSSESNHGLEDQTFEEAEMSDDDYIEMELDAEPELEPGDDILLVGDSYVPCAKQVYENGWSANTPAAQISQERFNFRQEDQPIVDIEDEQRAFLSMISYGIIGQYVTKHGKIKTIFLALLIAQTKNSAS